MAFYSIKSNASSNGKNTNPRPRNEAYAASDETKPTMPVYLYLQRAQPKKLPLSPLLCQWIS